MSWKLCSVKGIDICGDEQMTNIVNNVPLWSVTIWDKSFNGIDRTWQPKTIRYKYLLSDELDRLNVGGTVRLLYTGQDIGFTTEELAGDALFEGEIVSIPWGGTPSVKYYKGKFVTGDNRIATSSKPGELLNKYLYYYLRGHLREIASYYRGAGLKHPAMKDVLKMSISYPSIADQEEIIKQFESLEKIINLRQQVFQKLDALIKARFVEMFGDVIKNNKGWPKYTFSEIATSRLGKMLDTKRQTGEHRFPYLANFNVQWFRFELESLNEMDFNEDDQKEYELKDGDLLVCEGGEIGRCAVWHNDVQPCFFQKALHRVRCDTGIVLPDYLARWFQYNCEHGGFASIEGAKATIAHLPGAKLKALQVVVPPIELQEQFASFVTQIDKSKSAVHKSLEETQMLFDSLMQEYFG